MLKSRHHGCIALFRLVFCYEVPAMTWATTNLFNPMWYIRKLSPSEVSEALHRRLKPFGIDVHRALMRGIIEVVYYVAFGLGTGAFRLCTGPADFE